jgi:hypothetical protein
MGVFIGLFIFLSLVYSAFITTGGNSLKLHFFPALGIKLVAGLGVGFLYFYHYGGGDTLRFDAAADLLSRSLHSGKDWFLFLFRSDLSFLSGTVPPFLEEPRSFFFIKILSLIYLITGRSYWVSSLFLSFFSFFGAWKLSITIVHHWPRLKFPVLISFLYFPTVVFWSAGVLKDALAYGAITLLASLMIRGMQKEKMGLKHYVTAFLLLWLLWSVKYHLAVVLILSVGAGMIYYPIQKKFKAVWGFFLIFLFLIGTTLVFSLLHPNFRPANLVEILWQNHEKIIRISEEWNVVRFLPYGTGLSHFLLNLPVSLFAGLFMPLPWQGMGLLAKITGIFNALILILSLLKIYDTGKTSIRWNVWIVMGVIYIGLLAIMMAYTTPNFGTLERYKSAYIPFYLLWIFNNERGFPVSKSLFFHKFWGTY